MSFHVPELARITSADHPVLGTTSVDGNNGAFKVSSPESGWHLFIICSDGTAMECYGRWEWASWEHVSAHADNGSRKRTPSWREMAWLKNLCWDEEDCVVQFHPPKSQYVNHHPHVLHLWRHRTHVFPVPPSELVGPR